MNDELKASGFQFIVQRSYFILSFVLQKTRADVRLGGIVTE
ncbi:MAG: hypothetical protein QOE95_2192 [Gaiellaceae bacterium]|nr:hypothetical protein [Gaiellaceae bacterium]